MTDIPEQQLTQVAQLRAERANAVAYGQTDIVAAVDRQLSALGVTSETADAEVPVAEVAASLQDSRTKAPQGRSATGPRQTTATADPTVD